MSTDPSLRSPSAPVLDLVSCLESTIQRLSEWEASLQAREANLKASSSAGRSQCDERQHTGSKEIVKCVTIQENTHEAALTSNHKITKPLVEIVINGLASFVVPRSTIVGRKVSMPSFFLEKLVMISEEVDLVSNEAERDPHTSTHRPADFLCQQPTAGPTYDATVIRIDRTDHSRAVKFLPLILEFATMCQDEPSGINHGKIAQNRPGGGVIQMAFDPTVPKTEAFAQKVMLPKIVKELQMAAFPPAETLHSVVGFLFSFAEEASYYGLESLRRSIVNYIPSIVLTVGRTLATALALCRNGTNATFEKHFIDALSKNMTRRNQSGIRACNYARHLRTHRLLPSSSPAPALGAEAPLATTKVLCMTLFTIITEEFDYRSDPRQRRRWRRSSNSHTHQQRRLGGSGLSSHDTTMTEDSDGEEKFEDDNGPFLESEPISMRFLFVGSSDCKISIFDVTEYGKGIIAMGDVLRATEDDWGETKSSAAAFHCLSTFPAHVNMVTGVACTNIPSAWLPPISSTSSRKSNRRSADNTALVPILLSSGRDGRVCVWDLRQLTKIAHDEKLRRIKNGRGVWTRPFSPSHVLPSAFRAFGPLWRPPLLKRIVAHTDYIQSLILLQCVREESAMPNSLTWCETRNERRGSVTGGDEDYEYYKCTHPSLAFTVKADGRSDGVCLEAMEERLHHSQTIQGDTKAGIGRQNNTISELGLFATGSADKHLKVWSLRGILAKPAEHDVNAAMMVHEAHVKEHRRLRPENAPFASRQTNDDGTPQRNSIVADNAHNSSENSPATSVAHSMSLSISYFPHLSEDYGAAMAAAASHPPATAIAVTTQTNATAATQPPAESDDVTSPLLRFQLDGEAVANLPLRSVYGDDDERSIPMPPTQLVSHWGMNAEVSHRGVAGPAASLVPQQGAVGIAYGIDMLSQTVGGCHSRQRPNTVEENDNGNLQSRRPLTDPMSTENKQQRGTGVVVENYDEEEAYTARGKEKAKVGARRPCSAQCIPSAALMPLFHTFEFPAAIRTVTFAAPSLLCVGFGSKIEIVDVNTRRRVGRVQRNEEDIQCDGACPHHGGNDTLRADGETSPQQGFAIGDHGHFDGNDAIRLKNTDDDDDDDWTFEVADGGKVFKIHQTPRENIQTETTQKQQAPASLTSPNPEMPVINLVVPEASSQGIPMAQQSWRQQTRSQGRRKSQSCNKEDDDFDSVRSLGVGMINGTYSQSSNQCWSADCRSPPIPIITPCGQSTVLAAVFSSGRLKLWDISNCIMESIAGVGFGEEETNDWSQTQAPITTPPQLLASTEISHVISNRNDALRLDPDTHVQSRINIGNDEFLGAGTETGNKATSLAMEQTWASDLIISATQPSQDASGGACISVSYGNAIVQLRLRGKRMFRYLWCPRNCDPNCGRREATDCGFRYSPLAFECANVLRTGHTDTVRCLLVLPQIRHVRTIGGEEGVENETGWHTPLDQSTPLVMPLPAIVTGGFDGNIRLQLL